MPKSAITDTSCLIVLSKINEVDLLKKTYKSVKTTSIVEAELDEKLPDWIKVVPLQNQAQQKGFELQVDKGEASVMALALEKPEHTVIIDDSKARKLADQLDLKITGIIGVIVKAKQRNIIKSVKPYLKRIRQTDFYMTDELEKIAVEKAGE